MPYSARNLQWISDTKTATYVNLRLKLCWFEDDLMSNEQSLNLFKCCFEYQTIGNAFLFFYNCCDSWQNSSRNCQYNGQINDGIDHYSAQLEIQRINAYNCLYLNKTRAKRIKIHTITFILKKCMDINWERAWNS